MSGRGVDVARRATVVRRKRVGRGAWRRAGRALAGAALIWATLAIAGTAPPAQASGLDVLRSCAANGHPVGTFGRRELEEALRTIPADLAEYSDCDEHIAASLRGIARHSRRARGDRENGGASGGGGATGRSGTDAGGLAGGDRAGGGHAKRSRDGEGPPAARSEDSPPADSVEGVAGALLSGAETVGFAPFDAIEAVAEGRVGLPAWLWPLLVVAGLLGVGAARERRA